jgi:hypothetical protein
MRCFFIESTKKKGFVLTCFGFAGAMGLFDCACRWGVGKYQEVN